MRINVKTQVILHMFNLILCVYALISFCAISVVAGLLSN